jgi:signal transduction histidine kinase
VNPARNKLWFAYWAGVVLIVSVLGWASARVYILEERNATARAENQRQEVIRLALWRMDSRLAPMIALEAARPIEDYELLIGEQNLRLEVVGGVAEDRVDLSVDAAVEPGSYNLGFFEIDEIGEAKGSAKRAIEVAKNAKDESSAPIGEIEKERDLRSASTPSSDGPQALQESLSRSQPDAEADYYARQQIADLAQSNRAPMKAAESIEESGKRDANKLLDDSGSDDRSSASYAHGYRANASEGLGDQSPALSVGAIEPRWVTSDDGISELVLTRTIIHEGRSIVQGVLLDWQSLSHDLISAIEDLLPTSTLSPIQGGNQTGGGKDADRSYKLATIPVAFHPGAAIAVDGDSITPALFAMLVTWIAVIGAMIAVGVVLRTVLNLSARRGRFVGAVTHELRTPLTTFRLYSQMLADGMVTDEAVRKDYLNTLKRESDRLTGIVENVLEYARISRQKGTKDKPKGEQTLSVGELMARIVPPMSRLGEQSGMDLIVSDSTADDAERTMTLDPHAVERIVMNLMDNACKYAGGEGDQDEDRDLRVHLDASVRGDCLLLVVADHGPGVPARDRRKIFGEFVRGSSGTMRDRSGLGLGLALSRGLAVELGGDLSLVRKRGHGAEFELRIPLNQITQST